MAHTRSDQTRPDITHFSSVPLGITSIMIKIDVDTVQEFFRLLAPESELLIGRRYRYRGQSDAEWGLVPSLYRKSSWDHLPVGVSGLRSENFDAKGVLKPNENLSQITNWGLGMRKIVFREYGVAPHILGDDSAEETYAQHIGLPTTLLDWTWNPLNAAYFALVGAAMSPEPGKRLVVACASESFVQSLIDKREIEVPRVPSAGNENLFAQKAVMIRIIKGHEMSSGDCSIISSSSNDLQGIECVKSVIGVALPHEFAAKALRGLREFGIDGAAMFPGVVGHEKLVREMQIL